MFIIRMFDVLSGHYEAMTGRDARNDGYSAVIFSYGIYLAFMIRLFMSMTGNDNPVAAYDILFTTFFMLYVAGQVFSLIENREQNLSIGNITMYREHWFGHLSLFLNLIRYIWILAFLLTRQHPTLFAYAMMIATVSDFAGSYMAISNPVRPEPKGQFMMS